MLISGFEAQVFLGIAVILGCSFIALLCDYLKGINERLREQVLELAVRKEEREGLERSLRAAMVDSAATANAAAAASAAAAPAPSAKPAGNGLIRTPAAAPAPVATPPPAPVAPGVEPAPAAAAAQPPAAPKPAVPEPAVVAVEPAPVAAEPAPLEILAVDEVPPPVTLAPALELTPSDERISLPEVTPAPAAEIASPEIVSGEGDTQGGNVVRIRVLRTPASAASEETPAATAAPAPPAFTQPDEPAPLAPYIPPATSPVAPLAPVAVTEPLRVTPAAATPSLPQLALSVDTPTVSPKAPEPAPAPAPLALPAGFTDRATLDFLKRDPAPFTGLVVSIGINDYARLAESQGKNTADDLVRNINQLVNSLIASPNGAQTHFACRTADDEFLVIYPNETGQTAQRRLNALSERLWDFQLRSLGTFSVVFSWGATEAVSENFSEAVSAASERMLETRQNRKTISMGQPLKKVVNG